ncbi:anthranilate synthase component I [Opitutales bacterium]|nr:anthranilate synthase component I [Opitutales bacterium]
MDSNCKPNYEPSLSEFSEDAKDYDLIAVQAEFSCDTETPLSAYAKLSDQKPAFLFESVVGGEQVSRFSFVGFGPRKVISCGHEKCIISEKGKETLSLPTPEDPLRLVEEEMSELRYRSRLKDGRFSGGAVGYLSYEYARRVEGTVPLPEQDELGLPLLYFMITDMVLIFDHARQTLTLTANVSPGNNPRQAYEEACKLISQTHERLATPSSLPPVALTEVGDITTPEGNFTQDEFEKLVERVKEYIKAGDVIQTVLSQRFKIPFSGNSTGLYRAIRAINPSPYMFLLEGEDFSIVGASPEVHVRLMGDDVLIRPIAGTRKRGSSQEEDVAMERELLADEKEKAEHLMLVDLARNDIGRVCKIGTVKAAEYMTIERYSHVMHIVSQVVGKLEDNRNAYDLMRATFPAGTVSGAPKVRAMQIIAEQEKLQRNAYAGALGYFGFEGNHDSCIAIRTAMVADGNIYLQAGAGIVADSIPENEYKETINKAKGMLKAIALAERFANSNSPTS